MFVGAVGKSLDSDLARVLHPLGYTINEVTQRINNFEEGNQDEADAVHWFAEEEGSIIEDLLGLSFVACEVYITRVTSTLVNLHRYRESHGSVALTTSGPNAREMRRFGYDGAVSAVSSVEMLTAAANYYKHRDQWGDDWQNASDQSKETVRVISLAGAKPNHANIFRLSEYLGNPDEYTNVSVFTDIFSRWRGQLVDAYEQELNGSKA